MGRGAGEKQGEKGKKEQEMKIQNNLLYLFQTAA